MKHVRNLAILMCSTLILASGCIAAAVHAAPSNNATVIVKTNKGSVQGENSGAVENYYNIPFAAPPVGELRWQSPQPVAAWQGTRDATKPGNACMQGASGDVTPNTPQSEDCLYLNVTTRAHNASHSSPVMVWLHGGGFTTGTAASYKPDQLVEQGNVTVVTVNYRLGIFGSYAQPSLSGAGTFGLQDQQAALKWVQQNIQNFGGNPRNVTLFGESSGGVSTCGQLTSPTAQGLFQKAIMESGACDTNISLTAPGTAAITPEGTKLFEPLQTAIEKSNAAANALGCIGDSQQILSCMRSKDAATMQKEMNVVSTPAYNTPALPEAPWKAVQEGHTIAMPILSGANQDESRFVIMAETLTGFPVAKDRYDTVLQQAFGNRASAIEQIYAPEKFRDTNGAPSYALALAALQTDRDFVCPQYATNAHLSWRMPVYTYNFADPQAISPIPSFIPGFSMGASHTSELYDLFNVTPQPVNIDGSPQELTPEQQALAATMRSYWTNFAHFGMPNGINVPFWPPYQLFHAVNNLAPEANGGIKPIEGSELHHCEVWQ